jgi:phage protein D
MAISEYRIFFDNEPADRKRLDRIETIRIEQAVDMVTEASLTLPIGVDDGGEWTDVLEDFVQPGTRVRVEVKVGDDPFVPLIEGRVVAQRFTLAGAPNESEAVIVVHDESSEMNRQDKVRLFEELAPEEIAEEVFGEYGFDVEVDSSGLGAASFERAVMQRGTDMQLLRRIARACGMVVYVDPGAAPGASVGRFRRLATGDDDLPELVLSGGERNVNKLTLELDALTPVTARADQLDPASLEVLSSEIDVSSDRPLGDVTIADLTRPKTIFVDGVDGVQDDLEAAAQAAVDRGAWAYTGEGEVSAEIYAGVMQPYRRVAVAGAGSRLSGQYLISEVTHELSDEGYTQRFTLRRNAYSADAGGGLSLGVF